MSPASDFSGNFRGIISSLCDKERVGKIVSLVLASYPPNRMPWCPGSL